MSFIRTTTGGWVNLAAVTAIGAAEEAPHGRTRHELRGGPDGRAFIAHVDGHTLSSLFTDSIPAPTGWRVLRAGQNDEGDWRVVSVVPVIAFGRGPEGLWEPLPADLLMDSQIANPTALQHDSGSQVFDIAQGCKFDDTGSWLASFTGTSDNEPTISIDAHRGHEDEPWRLKRMDTLRRVLVYHRYDQTVRDVYNMEKKRTVKVPVAAVAGIYDHKGHLTVTWTAPPTPEQKDEVEGFWVYTFHESDTVEHTML